MFAKQTFRTTIVIHIYSLKALEGTNSGDAVSGSIVAGIILWALLFWLDLGKGDAVGKSRSDFPSMPDSAAYKVTSSQGYRQAVISLSSG